MALELKSQQAHSATVEVESVPRVQWEAFNRDEAELAAFGKKQQLKVSRPLPPMYGYISIS